MSQTQIKPKQKRSSAKQSKERARVASFLASLFPFFPLLLHFYDEPEIAGKNVRGCHQIFLVSEVCRTRTCLLFFPSSSSSSSAAAHLHRHALLLLSYFYFIFIFSLPKTAFSKQDHFYSPSRDVSSQRAFLMVSQASRFSLPHTI